MTEIIKNNRPDNLPSGYLAAELLHEEVAVDESVLPWLEESYELSVSQCSLEGNNSFLLASAVGSHDRLKNAANAMTSNQRKITDNMFYSRIAGFLEAGYSNNVETMPKPSTDFPIHVMRNKGGQRVYFGIPEVDIEGEPTRVVMRLGVCDKNKQSEVFKVLSSSTSAENRKKTSK